MEKTFSGKVALVTGAASGIGRASALTFAREGAKVALADIDASGGEETVSIIKKAGGEAFFSKADVSIASEVSALVARTIQTYGRIDFAHNNAGTEGAIASVMDCTEENWDKIIKINLKGIWLCMKYELPQMLKQGGGVIVNSSSVTGLVGFRGLGAYSASKHGIIGLTKTAALEFAKAKIRINAICPGLINTPMLKRQTGGSAQVESQLVSMEPLGRMGTPEEVAEAVVWLCSDRASFITGQAIPVDGGWVSQ